MKALLFTGLLALLGVAQAEEKHVYLLIGQSNMAGRAPIAETDAGVIEGCLLLNGEDQWEPAKEPMNRHSSIQRNISMQKLGPAYGFAQSMTTANNEATLCLVVNARGATTIEQWAKGTKYYNEAVRRAKIAQKEGELKGILWHQGESNHDNPAGYVDKLCQLVKDLREDLGDSDLPFVAGQIIVPSPVNDEIARLPGKLRRTGVASSEGLKTQDRWHFDAPSAKLLGQRYAEQILAIQKKAADEKPPKPNVVIIFTDDQGYGDLGCFGSEKIKTPQIDRMAREGLRLTSFMVGSSVCSPSRAALLTGCYPKSVGLHEGVLFADSTIGLNPDEHTIPDHLKALGYATACIGKWHLGHHPETLPTRHGFDEFYGIPYSNDMNHPDDTKKFEGGKILWSKPDLLWKDQKTAITHWNTPLMEGETIIELPTDQRTVTRRYTDKAIEFMKKNTEEPFFIYLAHAMPHVPLYVPEDVYDPDPQNAYTNVIEHIDAETGRLLDAIRELGLDENTYVIFTSDNGPWTYLKNHAGSAGPLRGHKSQTWEGGMRVPFVIWGPGIPAGTESAALVTALDLLPTIASLTGSTLPDGLQVDGIDISNLLADPTAASPRKEFLYYSRNGALEGIRQDHWKLLRRGKRQKKGEPKIDPPQFEMLLFDLSQDVGEKNNLAEANPALVTSMDQRMQELDAEVTKHARLPWKKP